MRLLTGMRGATLCAALLAQAGGAANAQIVLGPANYSALAEATEGGEGQSPQITGQGTVQAANLGMIGSEKGSASALPVQHVFASGSVEEGPLGDGVGFVGDGQAALTYAFKIIDNGSAFPHPVSMDIRAFGNATANGQGSGSGSFQLSEGGETVLSLSECAGLGCLPGQATSFNYLQPMSLLTGTNYVISLRPSAGVANFDAAPFSGSGTALVDPYFSLDASVPDPGDYTLLFSPGIINSPDNVAVPELSTWAMMLLGFAGLGFAGYRSSRKNAPVAA